MTGIPKSSPTDYSEPTYRLTLTPVPVSQDHDHRSLTKRVNEAIHAREIPVPQSPKKAKKVRQQVAHSLMHRPDQKSSMQIKLPLAEKHKLIDHIVARLQEITTNRVNPANLKSLAELLFYDCPSDQKFIFLLGAELSHIKDQQLHSDLIKEVMKIRNELKTLHDGKMQYIRPAAYRGTDMHPSSHDELSPDVQNARMNLDQKGHVIYSTGRLETERKALQVLYPMAQQTLNSGQVQLSDLPTTVAGIPIFPVMIENLMNSTPFVRDERKHLLKEAEVLRTLSGTVITLSDPVTHQPIQVQLQLMHFSTQVNYNVFLGQSHRFSSTGSDIAEQITDEGTEDLENYYNSLKEKPPLDRCFEKLKKCTNLQDRLILRAFIAELLGIPYHVHCKHSKDRTAAAVSIKKGFHQYLITELWKSPTRVTLPDPVTLARSSLFREYSEAAFFENLPMTDQGIGISGELDGRIYTQNRGFKFKESSLLEHTLPTSVLSDRYLKKASVVERALKGTLMSIATIALLPLYIAITPIILAVLHHYYKNDFWEAYKYITLAFLLIPVQSFARGKWLDRNSPVLKERSFFKTKNKSEISPELKQLYADVEGGKIPDQKMVKAHFDDLALRHRKAFTKLDLAQDLIEQNKDDPAFLVSYLRLFKESDLRTLIDPLLLEGRYSGVLKTVLTPRRFQMLCSDERYLNKFDPMAPLVVGLDGSLPKDRFTKEMKYRYFFENMIEHLDRETLILPDKSDEPLVALCIEIENIVRNPGNYKNARKQYQIFVKKLRQAVELANKCTDRENICVKWLNNIALCRFAGIHLEEYCEGLVRTVSGDFETPLTLDNFWDEFQARNGRIKKMPSKYKFNKPVKWLQQMRSHANVDFDPLARSNVPYIYGPITTLNDHTVTALRHGSPVKHSDPIGFFGRLFGSKKESKVPEITSDYRAFAGQEPKILHIILENGDRKRWDESARVQARRDITEQNFHAMALRMDGEFVDPKEFICISMEEMKRKFKAQLLGSFEKTKFELPEVVVHQDEFVTAAMKTVQEAYFRDTNYFYTKEEYQAFIFLTYAEMTLTLCETLGIDYLEAACKDDIDRGGAFKAILKLHSLAQRDELTPKALEEIMVQLIAAPLIVAHRPIIESRGKFVKNVIDVMRRHAVTKI